MTVNDINAVRRKFQESGITYQVVKNVSPHGSIDVQIPAAGVAELLKGSPTGVVFGGEDAVSAAKLTFEFIKDYERSKLKVEFSTTQRSTRSRQKRFQRCLRRAELQAKIVGQALSPGANLAGQLKALEVVSSGAIETVG